MQTYELLVKNRAITALSEDTTLVRTSRGVDQVRVYFDDDEWLNNAHVTVIYFINGDVMLGAAFYPQAITGGEHKAQATVEVPDEVLRNEGPLGVTVQYRNESEDVHLITAKAHPLTVELEGEAEGPAPGPSPLLPPLQIVEEGHMPSSSSITWDGNSAFDVVIDGYSLGRDNGIMVLHNAPVVLECPPSSTYYVNCDVCEDGSTFDDYTAITSTGLWMNSALTLPSFGLARVYRHAAGNTVEFGMRMLGQHSDTTALTILQRNMPDGSWVEFSDRTLTVHMPYGGAIGQGFVLSVEELSSVLGYPEGVYVTRATGTPGYTRLYLMAGSCNRDRTQTRYPTEWSGGSPVSREITLYPDSYGYMFFEVRRDTALYVKMEITFRAYSEHGASVENGMLVLTGADVSSDMLQTDWAAASGGYLNLD